MMNIFNLNNYLKIVFSDGIEYETEEVNEDLLNLIYEDPENEEAIRAAVKMPDVNSLKERVENSNILILRGASVYMKDVSEISIPEDFVIKILDAEDSNNEKELNKYINFWKLLSLNPDARVRNNLFWFIRKWDMQITEGGLIRAYRNADIKSTATFDVDETKLIINEYYTIKYINGGDPYKEVQTLSSGWKVNGKVLHNNNDKVINIGEAYDKIVNGDNSPVFTDHHSHTFTIKLGQPVSMPREQVDENQEHSCSSGLHVGAKSWLKQNYFGNVGLEVLVNPAQVCAVPTIDDYGKMRVCEYFPVAIVDFDDNGDIIESELERYNDLAYLKTIIYEGEVNNEDVDHYQIANYYSNREDIYRDILADISV